MDGIARPPVELNSRSRYHGAQPEHPVRYPSVPINKQHSAVVEHPRRVVRAWRRRNRGGITVPLVELKAPEGTRYRWGGQSSRSDVPSCRR